jgi:hypothetical protein
MYGCYEHNKLISSSREGKVFLDLFTYNWSLRRDLLHGIILLLGTNKFQQEMTRFISITITTKAITQPHYSFTACTRDTVTL